MKSKNNCKNSVKCKITKWIPCSEKLPKKDTWVLCQCHNNVFEVMKLRYLGDWYLPPNIIFDTKFVVAWMPLSELYKEIVMSKEYTFVEVMNKTKELLDNAGRISGFCQGIKCEKCPLNELRKNGYCQNRPLLNPKEFADFVMNYQEPVDWSKVEVDTPILVKDEESNQWLKRHFAKYEKGKVYTFLQGRTSFTDMGTKFWECAKLYDKKETNIEY